jgi:PadR family transcriptional regulator PadR
VDKPKLELLPGTLELLVLRTLAPGPQHGYGIARRLHQQTAEELKVEEGSLYPALHRMEKRGWIQAEWGPSELNRRAKYYRLTNAGRRELKARTADWERLALAIGRVLGAPQRGT